MSWAVHDDVSLWIEEAKAGTAPATDIARFLEGQNDELGKVLIATSVWAAVSLLMALLWGLSKDKLAVKSDD